MLCRPPRSGSEAAAAQTLAKKPKSAAQVRSQPRGSYHVYVNFLAGPVATGQAVMALNQTRGDLDWTQGR